MSQQSQLIESYKEGLANGRVPYLDADDFERVIDHFEEQELFEEAIEACDHALRLHPANETILGHKAKNLMYLDREEEAELIVKVLSDNNDFSLLVKAEYWLGLDDTEKCLATLDLLLEKFGEDVYIYLDIVDFLTAYDEFELSVEYLRKGLARFPDNENLLGELTLAYERSEKWEKSIAVLNQLLDINPYSLTYWLALARNYSALKEFDRSQEACEFALTIDSNNVEAHLILSDLYYSSGNYKRAYETFMRLVELNGKAEKAAMYTLAAECKLQEDEHEEAFVLLNKALEENPSFSYAYYTYATIYYKLDQYDKALEYVDYTLAADDENSEAHYLKGSIYFQKGLSVEAEEEYIRAVEIDPSKIFLLRTDLKEAILADDYPRIKEECLQVLGYFPDTVIFNVMLLSYAYKNGDDETTEKYLAITQKLTNPEAIEEEWTEYATALFLRDVCQTEEKFTRIAKTN